MKTVKIVSVLACVVLVAVFCIVCLNDSAPKADNVTRTSAVTKVTQTEKLTNTSKIAQTAVTKAVSTATTTTKKATAKKTTTTAKATTTKKTTATTKAAPEPPVSVYLPAIPQLDVETKQKLDDARQELAVYASQFYWDVMILETEPLSGIMDVGIAFCQGDDSDLYSVSIGLDEKGNLCYSADGEKTTVEAIKKYLDDNGVHFITDEIDAL